MKCFYNDGVSAQIAPFLQRFKWILQVILNMRGLQKVIGNTNYYFT